MTHAHSPEYKHILSQALRLPSAERIAMIEALAASFREHPVPDDAPPFTSDEIKALMQITPKTPAEIIAGGYTGTWADLGIEDGADWVNEQKRQRKARLKW